MSAFWLALLFAVALVVLMAGCARPPAVVAPPGVELTPIRTISRLEAGVLLRLTGVKDMPVRYDVDCYRMLYRAPNGERLSGLFALPRGATPIRVASFQHGTATTRSAVPSQPDGTGIAAAIVFAGNGYALVAPDYPGMGVSPGAHPYYVAERIAPAIASMIEAAQAIEGVPNTPPFLAGFSEGGWASLAALRLMEAEGNAVLASAQVAGAYDLRDRALPMALAGGAKQHALYLAYAAWGQAAHYGHPLDTLLTTENAALVDRLFNGAKPEEIVAALPANPRALYNAEFLRALDEGGSHWFLDTFAANSLNGVTPRAPVRMYYGSADTDVLPEQAIETAHEMAARGADVQAIDVGPVGHDASMLAAAPLMLAWLRELERAQQR